MSRNFTSAGQLLADAANETSRATLLKMATSLLRLARIQADAADAFARVLKTNEQDDGSYEWNAVVAVNRDLQKLAVSVGQLQPFPTLPVASPPPAPPSGEVPSSVTSINNND